MYNPNCTIIVTGSNGMVGSALKKIVYNQPLKFNKTYNWIWLTRKDLDLEDNNKVYAYFSNYDYKNTIVINLAANVGGLFKNIDSNLTMYESNLKININLLEVCRKLKISKLINILSTCIFPDNAKYPLTESQINNGLPHISNPGYSYSKRTAQIYSHLINESSDYFKYVNLIPTNLYGKHDNYSIKDGHVIPSIIHKCFKIIKSNSTLDTVDAQDAQDTQDKHKTLILPGNGDAERMFLYDEDFANIILDFACFIDTKGDYIVSGSVDKSMEIRYLAETIKLKTSKITGNTVNIEFEDDDRFNGQTKKPCSNKKLIDLYKFHKKHLPIDDNGFENNLENVMKYFWDNYDEHIRK